MPPVRKQEDPKQRAIDPIFEMLKVSGHQPTVMLKKEKAQCGNKPK